MRNRCVNVRRTAHEDVERGEVGLWPSVDRDMAFGEHQHSGNAHRLAKVVEMRLQDRRPRRFGRAFQDGLQMRRLVEPLGTAHIDQGMRANLSERAVSHRQTPAIRW